VLGELAHAADGQHVARGPVLFNALAVAVCHHRAPCSQHKPLVLTFTQIWQEHCWSSRSTKCCCHTCNQVAPHTYVLTCDFLAECVMGLQVASTST
jgi:hypothetical protein